MGCDIHMYVEYKRKDSERWSDFGGRLNPGRSYSLFNNLAGVRGESNVQPKGRLKDMAYAAQSDDSIYVSDEEIEGEDTYTRAEALDRIAKGYCEWTDEREYFITNSDHHSHSWATADELEKAVKLCEWGGMHEYYAVIATMRSFESQGFDCRAVYWFDN